MHDNIQLTPLPSPKVASAELWRGDQFLLIKRAFAPFEGYWTFPGGRLEAAETDLECVKREIKEELSLTMHDVRFELALRREQINVFSCGAFSGKLQPNTEITDFAWIDQHQLAHFQTTPLLGEVVEICAASRE